MAASPSTTNAARVYRRLRWSRAATIPSRRRTNPGRGLQDRLRQACDPNSWKDPSKDDGEYAKQTRSLGGFIARTYSLKDEAGGNADTYNGQIYWDLGEYSETNKYAVGKSKSDGEVNGEDLRGVKVDASGEIRSASGTTCWARE